MRSKEESPYLWEHGENDQTGRSGALNPFLEQMRESGMFSETRLAIMAAELEMIYTGYETGKIKNSMSVIFPHNH